MTGYMIQNEKYIVVFIFLLQSVPSRQVKAMGKLIKADVSWLEGKDIHWRALSKINVLRCQKWIDAIQHTVSTAKKVSFTACHLGKL